MFNMESQSDNYIVYRCKLREKIYQTIQLLLPIILNTKKLC